AAVKLFDVSVASEASPMVSPDGSWIAYTDFVGGTGPHLFIRPVTDQATLATGAPIQISTNGVQTQTWASDSRRLVAKEGTTFSCEQGTCSRGIVTVYDIDPDGNGIIDQIDRTDINSSTPLRNVTGDNPDWSPTADRVAVWGTPIGGGGFDLHLFDFSNLSAVVACRLTDTTDSEVGVAFSPDGGAIAVKRMATGNGHTSIALITLGATGSDGCPVVVSDTELIPTREGGKNSIEYREIDWR
ncbi:MAG: PD40 domain-containing protein, partial [Gemmatimonadetes bacterium]|nr:PD40 domain-containing protein [Gemmatimonadota bacterium]